jgi:thiopurine S-methyltransferase
MKCQYPAIKVLVLISFFVVTMSTAFATESAAAPSRNEGDERLATWSDRWANNNLGWHLDHIHETLVKYGSHIVPDADTCSGEGVKILVPLCGKTNDLAHLASQKHVQVVGVDGVRKALETFTKEHPSLEIEPVESCDKFERFKGRDIELLKGDFFDVDETTTGGRFDAIWDRAAIIAIQPELREMYVETISKVLKPGGTLLLSALERRTGTEEAIKAGPPFSLSEKEVRRLYESQDWVETVELLEEIDQFERKPSDKERFSQKGVTSMFELVFLIKAKE